MNFGTISLLFKQIFEMTLLKFSLEYLEIFRTLPQSFPSQQDLTSYMMHLNVALTIKKGSIISVVGKSTVEIMEPFLV